MTLLGKNASPLLARCTRVSVAARAAASSPAIYCPALPADKQIDLSTVDLKKLRVKELKKILDDWGEMCKGCAEKSDYIRKINELMPKYAPKAASARTDL